MRLKQTIGCAVTPIEHLERPDRCDEIESVFLLKVKTT
jgi:hypothetical protein